LKKTSIQLGQGFNSAISEFSKSFNQKSFNDIRPDLPKRDFKSHSSVLGTMNSSFTSTSSKVFHASSLSQPKTNNSKSLEKNLRKHHFSFGDEKFQNITTFTESFHEKAPEKADQLHELKNDIRDSHFSFGQYPRVVVSTSSQQFRPVRPSSSCGAFNRQSKQNSLIFSQGQEKLISTFTSSFEGKPAEFQATSCEKVIDLKTSHFKLGHHPSTYSKSSTQLKPQSANQISRKGNISIDILASHFEVGKNSHPFVTSYEKDNFYIPHKGLNNDSKIDPLRHLESQIKSKLTQTPQSVSQGTFKRPDPKEISKTDPQLIKDLKSHHFDLGSENVSMKTSSSLLSGAKGQPAKFEENLLKQVVSSHFVLGNQVDKSFLSLHQKDFQRKKTVIENNSQMMKDLRSSHFKVGDDRGEWRTEQKSKFNWIRPVPDNEFHAFLLDKS
jgi:hypothetical protein